MTANWRLNWKSIPNKGGGSSNYKQTMSNGLVKKRIAIFGSTGSIGRQALEVIDANPSAFSVEVLTAQSNDELLIKQALHFKPDIVVIGDEKKYLSVREALA